MTSKTKYRHRYRCRKSKCRTRFTVKHSSTREIKCPSCGTYEVRSIEAERRREDAKRGRCTCYAYPFPHRPGSLRMCAEHPLTKAGVEPTEDEYRQHEGCLMTPRSG